MVLGPKVTCQGVDKSLGHGKFPRWTDYPAATFEKRERALQGVALIWQLLEHNILEVNFRTLRLQQDFALG